MDKVINRLRARLLENPVVEIKETAWWSVPITVFDTSFTRVKRSKMDILMKMMMIAFQQTDIRRAANLTEMLLVDELFISDLMEKMQRWGQVRVEKSIFKLTKKGREQLESGIMEEEVDAENSELFYSATHDAFLPETKNDFEKKCPFYRYVDTEKRVDDQRILQVLSEQENRLDENGFQTIVSDVHHFEERTVQYAPCLEFQLYNKEQDIFYARVWNTWLERWDDKLEKQIEEKERVEWREKWME
ncbi:hypothetical protein ACM26V_03315 [Salipaludibacillus sp. HK11]|uniref:hypothetical protein n=1 Tax=Salipaludibacillus sp. HK11 TaxID=3394320 RepID=UPI0039FD2308